MSSSHLMSKKLDRKTNGRVILFSPHFFNTEPRKVHKERTVSPLECMNPGRTSFLDLRETEKTSCEEKKWDEAERRGRGSGLEQTTAETATLGGDKAGCLAMSSLLQTTLSNSRYIPRKCRDSPRMAGESIRRLFTRAFLWGQLSHGSHLLTLRGHMADNTANLNIGHFI